VRNMLRKFTVIIIIFITSVFMFSSPVKAEGLSLSYFNNK